MDGGVYAVLVLVTEFARVPHRAGPRPDVDSDRHRDGTPQ